MLSCQLSLRFIYNNNETFFQINHNLNHFISTFSLVANKQQLKLCCASMLKLIETDRIMCTMAEKTPRYSVLISYPQSDVNFSLLTNTSTARPRRSSFLVQSLVLSLYIIILLPLKHIKKNISVIINAYHESRFFLVVEFELFEFFLSYLLSNQCIFIFILIQPV